jgi:hypothetical protein
VQLRVLPRRLAICRLGPTDIVPSWAAGEFVSVTRTESELSIVCAEESAPADVTSNRGWRALRVEGVLDFALTGVLASLAQPLAEAAVSIFAVSTFDTDYVLVKEADLMRATEALSAAGHGVVF